MKFIYLNSLFLLLFFQSYSQKKTVYNTQIGKAGTVNIYNGSQVNQTVVLNTDKYLNTNQPITILIGSNVFLINNVFLEEGIDIMGFAFGKYYGDSALFIKIVKGSLRVDADLYDFDDNFLFKIRNNKLIENNKNYETYFSGKYLEVIDQNIPIIQIELDKWTNSIQIFGFLNFEDAYAILGKSNNHSSFSNKSVGMEYLKVSREELKKIALKEALQNIKSLHDGKLSNSSEKTLDTNQLINPKYSKQQLIGKVKKHLLEVDSLYAKFNQQIAILDSLDKSRFYSDSISNVYGYMSDSVFFYENKHRDSLYEERKKVEAQLIEIYKSKYAVTAYAYKYQMVKLNPNYKTPLSASMYMYLNLNSPDTINDIKEDLLSIISFLSNQ